MVRACAKTKAQTLGNLRLVIVGGSCPDLYQRLLAQSIVR
jgi:hypothetical protein